MNTQHTKMAVLGAGVVVLAAALQSFSSVDDKGKMKRYEIIHHANGQTLEYDTVVPMTSNYTVEQFLADKGISSDNVKIVKVPSLSEGGMIMLHGEEGGDGQQIVVREHHRSEDVQWNEEGGKEVKITCEVGPDGKMVTRKIVDGVEVEMSETELNELHEKHGNPGEHRIILHKEMGDHPTEGTGNGEQMDVKIKCEIDENGEIHARKWVNGEEVELSEQELNEMRMPHEDGQKVIIRMEHNSEGGQPSEEQIIEIEQILEELGAGEEGEHKMVFIETETINGDEEQRHVIQLEGDETIEWKEDSRTEVKRVTSDEEDFTVVLVTENIDPSTPQAHNSNRAEKPNNISIYPNPSSGLVTVEFSNSEKVKTEVKITDMNGKVVFSEDLGKFSGSWRKEVDLNRFGKGNYLITIQQGKDTVSEKIIVE